MKKLAVGEPCLLSNLFERAGLLGFGPIRLLTCPVAKGRVRLGLRAGITRWSSTLFRFHQFRCQFMAESCKLRQTKNKIISSVPRSSKIERIFQTPTADRVLRKTRLRMIKIKI